MATAPAPERARLQERLESSPAGQVLISLAIVATLLTVLVINLPESHVRREASKVTQPYANAIGVDQAWGVFAPDPRREVVGLVARITYADGRTEDWEPPQRGALVGGYSDYHWRKLLELATAGTGQPGAGRADRALGGRPAPPGRGDLGRVAQARVADPAPGCAPAAVVPGREPVLQLPGPAGRAP